MRRHGVGAGAAYYLAAAVFALAAAAQTQPPIPAQEEPEYLAQGPVHEAFAEPVSLSEEQGFVAPVAPPGVAVDEAAGERPSPQAVWIAGYWAWGMERNVYVWVSGCWRVPPAGKHWVAGYWTATDKGWVWTPGYWADNVRAPQVAEYLPAPPALVNVAPPAEAPSFDVVWVPPCWYWRNGRYVLRAGYWLDATPGWVWQPSHYVRTTRGYVFVPGYWDYPLAARGVLYAPVLLPPPVIRRPSFSLALGVSVNLGWMELNLFSAPRYGHYYFGDYYDDSCVGFGIYPWFSYRSSWAWYDPLYEHRRWNGRRGGGARWDDDDRHNFDRRRQDKDLRPPKTYREMEQRPSLRPAGVVKATGGRDEPGRGGRDNDTPPLLRVGTRGGAAAPSLRPRPAASDGNTGPRDVPAGDVRQRGDAGERGGGTGAGGRNGGIRLAPAEGRHEPERGHGQQPVEGIAGGVANGAGSGAAALQDAVAPAAGDGGAADGDSAVAPPPTTRPSPSFFGGARGGSGSGRPAPQPYTAPSKSKPQQLRPAPRVQPAAAAETGAEPPAVAEGATLTPPPTAAPPATATERDGGSKSRMKMSGLLRR